MNQPGHETGSDEPDAVWQPRQGGLFKAIVWLLLGAIALGSIAIMAAVLMM